MGNHKSELLTEQFIQDAQLDLGYEGFHPLTVLDDSPASAGDYFLFQNFPNPASDSTTIRYSLPKTSTVVIKVYDMIGKEVATIVDDIKPAGIHAASFNAANHGSGLYFYTLIADRSIISKRMVVV
jgi:hypothetical protein